MSKLYYTESYSTHFQAEVIQMTEQDGSFHIVLDQTLFYPGTGDMPCDIGFIEDCPITHVYEQNNCIYHVSPKKPIKIHKAKCHIDWQARFDHMQQHTLQHILSARLKEHFNATTLKVHLGQEICTLDIDIPFKKEAFVSIEELVNQDILNNHSIHSFYPTKKELKKLPLKHTKAQGDIRVVEIQDIDISICPDIHLKSTLDAQLLRILKVENFKGYSRLTFIGGTRAIKHITQTSRTVQDTTHELTATIQKLENEVRILKQTIADYEAQHMLEDALLYGDTRIVCQIISDATPKSLQSLGNKLTAHPKVIALLACIHEQNAHLSFMCSTDLKQLNMSTLLKDSITLLDGRGGGTWFGAQGAGKSTNNLDSTFQYTLMKLKSMI